MPNSYETTYVKKFLDANGLAHFAQKLNQYPTNDVIEAVVEGVQDALDEKLNVAEKGAASGVAPLDANQKVPTTNLPVMTGADASQTGTAGLVPAPMPVDSTKFLRGDGTWVEGGRPMVILSYGNSTWNDFIEAYNNNVIVYCRASSNSNPATGSQTRMAFMAYVNNATSPTEVEFQYYRSVSSHSDVQQGDQTYVYKLTSANRWTVTVRENYTKVVAGTGLSGSWNNGAITLNASTMQGATESQAGSAGMVPAPASGETDLYLKSDGTWDEPGGSSIYQFTLDNMTNASGVYSHSTAIPLARASMKAVNIECSNPDAFLDAIAVTISNGSILVECNNVLGSSTISVTAAEQDNGEEITVTQYDLLIDKIGDITNLSTTNKSSLTVAVNELNNNKIDKPTSVAAGKFLQTDSNGNAVWGNAVLPTDVENAVTNWLDDNIPTGQTVAVDQSLTVSGAAADAKVVGGDISDLKSAVTELEQRVDSLEIDKADIIISSASGSVASFPDGAARPVDDLTVKIEPVQDLNGYDSPWPAGGGANLLDLSKASFSSGAYGLSITRTEDIITVSGTVSNTSLTNLSFAITTNYSTDELSGKGYVCQVFTVGTPTHSIGGVWGFRTESERAFAISLINAPQGSVVNVSFKMSVSATSQTAWSPYENVCPISGWTGANVTRTGKNLVHTSVETRTQVGVTWICDGTSKIVSEGTATGGTSFSPGFMPIPQRAGTFTASFYTTATGNVSYTLVKNGAWFRSISSGNSYTFTVALSDIITGYVSCRNGGDATGTSYIQIELGPTATDYEPYQGNTYDITFPSEAGTVYGGTLDVTTGVLNVTDAMIDLGEYTSIMSNNGVRNGNQLIAVSVPNKNVGLSNFSSDMFSLNASESGLYTMHGRETTKTVEFEILLSAIGKTESDPADDRMAAAKQWFITNKPQLCYELATSITYQLTPQEIRTLLGMNNIWADTGDTSVTYKADTKLYIDNKITQAIAAALSA